MGCNFSLSPFETEFRARFNGQSSEDIHNDCRIDPEAIIDNITVGYIHINPFRWQDVMLAIACISYLIKGEKISGSLLPQMSLIMFHNVFNFWDEGTFARALRTPSQTSSNLLI